MLRLVFEGRGSGDCKQTTLVNWALATKLATFREKFPGNTLSGGVIGSNSS